MHRSYQLRLKTTQRQAETLTALLLQLCELYNMCLEQRRRQECAHCGLVLGRDHNAALNILALGESAVVP